MTKDTSKDGSDPTVSDGNGGSINVTVANDNEEKTMSNLESCPKDEEEELDTDDPKSNELPPISAELNELMVQHDQNEDNIKEEDQSIAKKIGNWMCAFYTKNSFLVMLLTAILLAYAYPPLGARYLSPKITATWIAVILIFLLSGIKLKTEELSKAFMRLKFNLFVQVFNFLVVSSVVFGFSRLLKHRNVISESLADGMVISASVPITINMVLVLTTSSNGDEAAAVFNAAFGNLVGVFLSPALILMYLGVQGAVDLGTVFFKLGLRVVFPIFVGQLFHKFSPKTVDFVKSNKKKFSKFQEYALVFIVYTVFCKTFSDEDRNTSAGDAFLMIAFVFLLLVTMMTVAWYALKILFPNEPKLRVMGLYGTTHKSVAMGVPLITAIYEENSNVGFYTLPLLVWHPMQLLIGSFLAPRLSDFVEREESRLDSTNQEIDANI